MKRPDMMVLQELMDDMHSMDAEMMEKKKRRGPGMGPTITIAIGEAKPMEEKMEQMTEEKPMDYGVPVDSPMSAMDMEDDDDEEDDEEDILIAEARNLGILDPEEMDVRLLKKLVEKKRMG